MKLNSEADCLATSFFVCSDSHLQDLVNVCLCIVCDLVSANLDVSQADIVGVATEYAINFY